MNMEKSERKYLHCVKCGALKNNGQECQQCGAIYRKAEKVLNLSVEEINNAHPNTTTPKVKSLTATCLRLYNYFIEKYHLILESQHNHTKEKNLQSANQPEADILKNQATIENHNVNRIIKEHDITERMVKEETEAVKLRQCPTCRKDISINAKSCPHCGEPFIRGFRPLLDEYNIGKMLGYVAVVLLTIGVFCPVISIPFVGQINYFKNGEGDGIIILLMAAISLGMILVNKTRWLLLPGLGSLAVIGFSLYNFKTNMQHARNEMEKNLAGNPFRGFADITVDSVNLEWGWVVLIIGIGMLFAAAVFEHNSKKKTSQNKIFNEDSYNILGEAWYRCDGVKGAILGGSAMMYLITFALAGAGTYLLSLVGTAEATGGFSLFELVFQTMLQVIVMIFTAGLLRMGINQAVGDTVSWRMIFSGFSFAGRVAVATILQIILISIGFLLLILPGIYLTVSYAMTLPLIIDKGLSPWEAMEASRKAVHRVWWRIAALFLAMGVVMAISAIPLGVGLIWTWPTFIIMIGLIYRQLFINLSWPVRCRT